MKGKGYKGVKEAGCNHGKKPYSVDRSATFNKGGKKLPMHMTAGKGSKTKV